MGIIRVGIDLDENWLDGNWGYIYLNSTTQILVLLIYISLTRLLYKHHLNDTKF